MAEEQSSEILSFQKPLAWVGLESEPIHFSNQALIQHHQNEFVLSFGHATSPPFLEPPTQAEVDSMGPIPIIPIVRLGMTPDRVLELIAALQMNYRGYQEELAKREV